MRIAFTPSTQYGNPVMGGGSEAEYAQGQAFRCANKLNAMGAQAKVFIVGTNGNAGGANEAVAWGANLVISHHSDGGYNPSSHFASLMCYQEDRTKPLASKILTGFCQRMGHTSRGLQKRTPGKDGVAVLRIPEASRIPAVLLEVCWHDRNPDAAQLRDPAWRDKSAQALAAVIAEIYNLGEEDEVIPITVELGGELGYVCMVSPVNGSQVLEMYGDKGEHDYSVYVYVHPFVGPSSTRREIKLGGYGNSDNVHGGVLPVDMLYPGLNGDATVVIHSPCPLVGGAK